MSKIDMARRYRVWLLSAAACGLVWLNLSSSPPDATVVGAVERPVGTPTANVRDTGSLPERLERPVLGLNDKDPFVPDVPKVVAKPPPPPPAPIVVAPPPPPEPPPLNLVYAGRMTGPDGKEVVYAAMGETPVVLTPGLDLPNGYKVTTINARTVEFIYPALNRTARLDIPPPQKYETR